MSQIGGNPTAHPGSQAEDRPPGLGLPPIPEGRVCSAWLWVGAIVAAIAGGFLAWAADEPIHDAFEAPMRQVVTMGYASMQSTRADRIAADAKNAAVAYGLLGGAFGLALGIVGGLARKSPRAALKAGAIGLIAGTILTAAVTLPVVAAFWMKVGDSPLTDDLTIPLLTHGSAWSVIGAVGGLALGLGLGCRGRGIARPILGGLIGSLIGTVIYEFTAAAVFPVDETTLPISASALSRLLARMAVVLPAAVLVVLSVTGRRADACTHGSDPGT